MAAAVNRYLWDTDHFVTQVDPGNMDCAKTHSCRDFVDYDSNLIAVAHEVGTVEQVGDAPLRYTVVHSTGTHPVHGGALYRGVSRERRRCIESTMDARAPTASALCRNAQPCTRAAREGRSGRPRSGTANTTPLAATSATPPRPWCDLHMSWPHAVTAFISVPFRPAGRSIWCSMVYPYPAASDFIRVMGFPSLMIG
jgi:hypothetical protein